MNINIVVLAALTLWLAACGGDGGSDDARVVFQGTLTQGDDMIHKELALKHSAGERIGDVEVCALGSCATTDSNGSWGFAVETRGTNETVTFRFRGHGIGTETAVFVPLTAEDVEIDFIHKGGIVEAHHIVVDGVEYGS